MSKVGGPGGGNFQHVTAPLLPLQPINAKTFVARRRERSTHTDPSVLSKAPAFLAGREARVRHLLYFH